MIIKNHQEQIKRFSVSLVKKAKKGTLKQNFIQDEFLKKKKKFLENQLNTEQMRCNKQ